MGAITRILALLCLFSVAAWAQNPSIKQFTNTQFQAVPGMPIKVQGFGSTTQGVVNVEAETMAFHGTNEGLIAFKGSALVPGLFGTTNPVQGPLNVRAIGVVGDGITDDTIALQSALNEANASGNACFWPRGLHRITSTLYATNVSIYGIPDQTWLIPDASMTGPALCILTTNSQAQNYSPKVIIRGIAINGSNAPNAYGYEIGTNYVGNGAYTANVTLDNDRADNFAGGPGFHIGNVVACVIQKCSAESNYTGFRFDGPVVGTTTSMRDSQARWSLGWGIIFTNFTGTIGPNVICEANTMGGIQAGLVAGAECNLTGVHFEKNWYHDQPWTNRADIEAYGPGGGVYKAKLTIDERCHFDNNNACLFATDVGDTHWINPTIYSPIAGGVRMIGTNSILTVHGFPQFQMGNLQSFFLSDSGAIVHYPQLDPDPVIFKTVGSDPTGNPNNLLQLIAYPSPGTFTTPLAVNTDWSSGHLYMTDTNASGHQFVMIADYSGVPGRFALYDVTAAHYVFDANASSFTVPNLSVPTNALVGVAEVIGHSNTNGLPLTIDSQAVQTFIEWEHAGVNQTHMGWDNNNDGFEFLSREGYVNFLLKNNGILTVRSNLVVNGSAGVAGTFSSGFVHPNNMSVSTLAQTDGTGNLVSIANAEGVLWNFGTGAFGYTTHPEFHHTGTTLALSPDSGNQASLLTFDDHVGGSARASIGFAVNADTNLTLNVNNGNLDLSPAASGLVRVRGGLTLQNASVLPNTIALFDASTNLISGAAPYTFKVSSTDTTPSYLTNKLVAGSNITLTHNNVGGVETITIASTGGGGAGSGDLTFDSPLTVTVNPGVSTNVSIIANGISDSLIRQSAGVSVVGRSANSAGNVADITASANGQFLARSGNALSFVSLASTNYDLVAGANVTITPSVSGTNKTFTVAASGTFSLTADLAEFTADDTNYLLTGGYADVDFANTPPGQQCEITLPSAGTYIITASVGTLVNEQAGSGWNLFVKLVNSTDASDIAGSERRLGNGDAGALATYAINEPPIVIKAKVTVGASKVIRLQASLSSTGGFTTGSVIKDYTTLDYIKL